MTISDCVFCGKESEIYKRDMLKNELFYTIFDKNPVTAGHILTIPKRHIISICELTERELIAMKDAINDARDIIDTEHKPDGYNIGVNEGEAAGQTVAHLHIHIIPRYLGDVKDPIGGIRNVIPNRGNYLKI